MTLLKRTLAEHCPDDVVDQWAVQADIIPEEGPLNFTPDTVRKLLKAQLPAGKAVDIAERLTDPAALVLLLEKERRITVLDAVMRNPATPAAALVHTENPKVGPYLRNTIVKSRVAELPLADAEKCGVFQTSAIRWWEAGRLDELPGNAGNLFISMEGLPFDAAVQLMRKYEELDMRPRLDNVSAELLTWLLKQSGGDNGSFWEVPLRSIGGTLPKVDRIDIPTSWETVPEIWGRYYTFRGEQTRWITTEVLTAHSETRRHRHHAGGYTPLIKLSAEALLNINLTQGSSWRLSQALSRAAVELSEGLTVESIMTEVLAADIPMSEKFDRCSILSPWAMDFGYAVHSELETWAGDQIVNGKLDDVITAYEESKLAANNPSSVRHTFFTAFAKAVKTHNWVVPAEHTHTLMRVLTDDKGLLWNAPGVSLWRTLIDTSPENTDLALKVLGASTEILHPETEGIHQLMSIIESRHIEREAMSYLLHRIGPFEADEAAHAVILRGISQMSDAPNYLQEVPSVYAEPLLRKHHSTNGRTLNKLITLHTEAPKIIAEVMTDAFGTSIDKWNLATSLAEDWDDTLQSLVDTVNSLTDE